MCGIFASSNIETLKELHRLNTYRGSLAYSLCEFRVIQDKSPHLIPGILYEGQGDISNSLLDSMHMTENSYVVGHTQAPTTQSGGTHPAVANGAFLWHNGIIKQLELGEGEWDTFWLLQQLTKYGFDVLSKVDGTFACVLYKGDRLYVFRNEISPLFFNEFLDLSSTKFEDSIELPANEVFVLDTQNQTAESVHRFKTKTNPYFFF